MTAPALQIRGSGTSWVITRPDGTPVSRRYQSVCGATAALRGVEQQLNPTTARHRRCRCGDSYMALPGQNTCPACRARAADRPARTTARKPHRAPSLPFVPFK